MKNEPTNNFTTTNPAVPIGTCYVILGNSDSPLVANSKEAVEAIQNWLRQTTGQQSTVRISPIYTLPKPAPVNQGLPEPPPIWTPEQQKKKDQERAEERANRPVEEIHAKATLASLASVALRRMMFANMDKSRAPEKFADVQNRLYDTVRIAAKIYPEIWAGVVEAGFVLPDLETAIQKCRLEDDEYEKEIELKKRAENQIARNERQLARIAKYQDVLVSLAIRMYDVRFPQYPNKDNFKPFAMVEALLACVTNRRLRLWQVGDQPPKVTSRKQVKAIWDIFREVEALAPGLLTECRKEWPEELSTGPDWMEVEEAVDNSMMTEN